jgi:hypothetical protein
MFLNGHLCVSFIGFSRFHVYVLCLCFMFMFMFYVYVYVFMFMIGILKMVREVFGYIGDHYYLNRFKNTNRIKAV